MFSLFCLRVYFAKKIGKANGKIMRPSKGDNINGSDELPPLNDKRGLLMFDTGAFYRNYVGFKRSCCIFPQCLFWTLTVPIYIIYNTCKCMEEDGTRKYLD